MKRKFNAIKEYWDFGVETGVGHAIIGVLIAALISFVSGSDLLFTTILCSSLGFAGGFVDGVLDLYSNTKSKMKRES
ncbi:MAG: hypothetical protein KDH96_08845 [Candidatus Riesia sp.]|nr:hypothetical protein [Candidatus Riesia sp.]